MFPMKSTIFLRQASNVIFFVCGAATALACGPYNPIIPTPSFFELDPHGFNISAYSTHENLKLWQSLTSDRIPLDDIYQAVYKDSHDEFYSRIDYGYQADDNKFYTYINNSADYEIEVFLRTAKDLEERWRDMRSPWYHPADRQYTQAISELDDIIATCREYNGERLKDRYALQIARAMFASRQYDDCINFTDSAFTDIPDCNLFKRMAIGYAAGCWSRLGDTDRADSLFAKAGDIMSISPDKRIKYMVRYNPGAPQLIEYIRHNATDTIFILEAVPVAQHLISDRRVANKGDWYFMLAYVDYKYTHNIPSARKNIYRAMNHDFSSENLRDLAHACKMKIDACTGNFIYLLSDLKWIESKTELLNSDAREWVRRCRNIIYVDWIPYLWRKRDYSTAILLCSYADNLAPSDLAIAKFKPSGDYIDYGSLAFQLMGSLSSSQLAAAYSRISADAPLYNFLRRKSCTSTDYYYEVIGTLALREENYSRAISYLSHVNTDYLRSMNINLGGYLSRDPFGFYPSRWKANDFGPTYEYESQAALHREFSNPSAKFDFARRMLSYKKTMTGGRTADERGLARLMYAIGRRNSFEECWALTQYWRGDCIFDKFYPSLQYWDDFADDNYNFLYDYNVSVGHRATESLYYSEIQASLAMLETDEARARAEYVLGNLVTVIRRYPGTSTATFVKTSCDNWKSWL